MTTESSPEAKSLAYVEGLGLNSVYEGVLATRKELDTKQEQLHEVRKERRRLEALRQDQEMEVAETLRSSGEMSQAAFDRQLKIDISNNADVRETKDMLLDLANQADMLEWEIGMLETDIKISVARLHELGGYFQFMAVLKSTSEARIAREAKQSREDGNPW